MRKIILFLSIFLSVSYISYSDCFSGRITSDYGYRIHPVTGEKGKWHNGIDVALPVGTQIPSLVNGTVISRGYDKINGYYIKVKGDDGTTVSYVHLKNSSGAQVNEKVVAGQNIAVSGNTGRSTGPHLHLTMRNASGKDINPLSTQAINQWCLTKNGNKVTSGTGTYAPSIEGNTTNNLKFSEEYNVSFQNILNLYELDIDKGLEKIISGIFTLFILLTILKIVQIGFKYIFSYSIEKTISELIRTCIAFCTWGYIIKNSLTIIKLFNNIFIEIGNYFTGNKVSNLDEIWDICILTTNKLWILINDWFIHVSENKIDVMLNINTYTKDFGIIILLIIVIFMIYISFSLLIGQIMLAILQFRLGTALSIPFMAGETNDFTKQLFGSKFITVLFSGGLLITVNFVILSLISEIINKVGLNNLTTIQEINIQNIYIFLATITILLLMTRRVNNITSALAE